MPKPKVATCEAGQTPAPEYYTPQMTMMIPSTMSHSSSTVVPPTPMPMMSPIGIKNGIQWEGYAVRTQKEMEMYQPLFDYFALRPVNALPTIPTIKCGVMNATKLREALTQSGVDLSDFGARILIRSIVEPGTSTVFVNFDQYCKLHRFILNACTSYDSACNGSLMCINKLLFAMSTLGIPITNNTAVAFINLPAVNPEAKDIIENGGSAPPSISKAVFLNIVAATALSYRQFAKWSSGADRLTIGFEEMMHMIAWFL